MSFDRFDEHTVFVPMFIFVSTIQVEENSSIQVKALPKSNSQHSFRVRTAHLCCENFTLKLHIQRIILNGRCIEIWWGLKMSQIFQRRNEGYVWRIGLKYTFRWYRFEWMLEIITNQAASWYFFCIRVFNLGIAVHIASGKWCFMGRVLAFS